MNTTTARLKFLVMMALDSALADSLMRDLRDNAQDRKSSFTPVIEEPFPVVLARDKAAKPRVIATQMRLLEDRYDLSRRVDANVTMSRGKPIPVGPTAKLKNGITWEQLGRMTPE